MTEATNGFKQTEIGLIPVEWEVVPLGEVASLTMGQSPPSSTYNTDGDGLPFLQGKAEFGETYPTPVKWCSQPKKVADPGSVLISVRAPVGDVNVARDDYCIGRGLTAINGSESLDNWFLFYLLIFAKRRLEDRGTGSTFKSINKGVLQSFSIPLPSLPEQRRIAHVLSTIQRAIAAQDDLIAAAREVKRSLMRRLFTHGPGPEPTPTKETEIGEIPEHWEVVPLIDMVEKTKQREPRKAPEASFQYIDVSSVSNKMFQIKSYTEYRGAEAPSRARRVVKSGDVIFATVRPYLKRIAVVPDHLDDQICSTAFCVIRARKDLADHKFIFYLMLSDDFVNRVSEHQRGSSYPAVSNTDVLNQSVPLPTLDEQREIACILSSADRKIEAEEQRKAALQALFKSMLQQLMTGRVRV